MRFRLVAALAAMLIISAVCYGQGIITPRRLQTSSEQAALPAALPVSAIKINARIATGTATVRVEQVFRNETDETLEGDYRFLIPDGATLVEFAVYDGETRRSSRATENSQRGLFQSRIYPLPPRSDKRIEIVYSLPVIERRGISTFEHDLGREYKKLRVPLGSVEIEVEVRSGLAIKSLTSPTHRIDIKWDDARHVTAKAAFGNAERFKLVYAQSGEENIGRNETSKTPGTGRRFSNSSSGTKDFAEPSNSTIAQPRQGAVVDPNGAAIPNATVTIRDQSTGATRTQTTDQSGNYSVAGLPSGTYKIEVDAPGFKKSIVENVAVQPGQVAAAGVMMSPGSVSETVTVTSVAPAADASIARASSYESANLRDLPSLAPIDSLARLSPGAASRQLVPPSAQSPGTDRNDEFRFWFNGNQARSNNFSIDGHDNNDIDGRPVISINNFDSIDTLHIMTTRGTGETTLTGASSINAQTRSGTNDFHGTVFDFHLNSRFSALSPLERRNGLEDPPSFRSNRYGGTFGGPARRDRFFFFGAFEGEAESSERFVDSTSSFLTPTARGLGQLKDAFPSSPTVNDLIRRGPMSIGSPRTGRTFLIPIAGVPVEFAQTARLIPSTAEGYEATARLDFNLTLRDTVRAGYWFSNRNATDSIGRLAAGFAADTYGLSQLASFHWEHTISPRTSNEANFTFNRAHVALRSQGETSFERPTVNTGFRGLGYGQSAFVPASHTSTLFEASDALSHIAGRHNFKIGGQWRRRSVDFDYLPGAGGQFNYASFEDFVLDRPATVTVAVGDSRSRFSQSHHHYFIDDVWRVKSNLTLSLGLSYENATQPINSLAEALRERESDAATALFDSTVPFNSPALAGLRRDNNNFAPRLGFAYTPRFFVFGRDLFGFDKTVIRGGVQIAYEQTAFRPLADVAASAPNVMLAVITPTVGALRFPSIPDAQEMREIVGSDVSKYARTDLARDYRTPYATVWHLTGSRELTERLSIEAAYAGSRGAKLIRAIDGASEGPLRIYETSGRSIYHSFQMQVDLRATRLLEGGASYTLSKLIDDVADNNSNIAGGVGNRASLISPALQMFAQNPFDVNERALSSLDRRHSLAGYFVLTLPWQRGQSGLLGRFAGGWKASGIIQIASGTPFTPLQYIGQSPALFAAALSDRLGATRPFAGNSDAPVDVVAFSNAANRALHFFLNPDGTPFISPTGFIIADHTGFHSGAINEARFIYNDFIVEQMARAMGLAPDAFGETFAAGRRFGDVGRNTLTGPRLATVDFALIKTTKITEKVSLQFRAEYYNLFNHPNRTNPNSIVENAGGFGFLDAGETDSVPRRVRFALKLIF